MRSDNLSRVITPVNLKLGAPMGRPNVGTYPMGVTRGNSGRMFKKDQPVVYTRRVNLINGYDKEGAYWGYPNNLYVEFTPDLTYIRFFRF